ncbi:hypothetical protein Holit_03421 [Hollandina sp. SP2]
MQQRQFFWTKILVLTNIVSLLFLAIVSLHYKVPQNVLIKMGIIENNNSIIYSHYDVRTILFSSYKHKEYKVVMLGDSITAGVEWNELLGISCIANRGIGSDTTGGILGRLSSIYELNPQMCFIMAGINDIGKNISVELIIENMNQIIEDLENHGIEVIIQSTLYVSDEHRNWKKTNSEVDKLNHELEEISRKRKIPFVDINRILSKNGVLRDEYTYDGVHLYGTGYKEWGKIIMEIIEKE